ncbi:MAG: hypothetical protein JWR51_430 [Devosia sp.]|uniref:hypothetical protein n=1 Tax=Devosia sp. TaxID=1871048 RepID=UPI002604F63F|nr:hypothetical protein [Devosia sp.]MDB5527327.1 hypothetical protein [Devosia sp.]
MTYSSPSIEPAAPSASALPPRLYALLAAWWARREFRRKFYGIEPRLLRDIGVDPNEIYRRRPRTIDEIPGDRLRVSLL